MAVCCQFKGTISIYKQLKLVKCMHKMMSSKKVFFKFIICTSNDRVELEQASKKHSTENEKNLKGERKFDTVNNHYV